MIYADIKGKTGVPEDVFTSNCIGHLALLPDNNLIDFFGNAKNLKGQLIDLSFYNSIEKLEYWPWLKDAGEPDILCILKNEDTNKRIALIIEIKHGSGKSSAAEIVSSDHDVLQNDKVDISNDQLAKYWQAARKIYGDTILIYLTHHRDLPTQDMESSIKETEGMAQIYWLSWFQLYQWIINKQKYPNNEVFLRILKNLQEYLAYKGYKRFQNWNNPIIKRDNKLFFRIYKTEPDKSVQKIYNRLYFMQEQITNKNTPKLYSHSYNNTIICSHKNKLTIYKKRQPNER